MPKGRPKSVSLGPDAAQKFLTILKGWAEVNRMAINDDDIVDVDGVLTINLRGGRFEIDNSGIYLVALKNDQVVSRQRVTIGEVADD